MDRNQEPPDYDPDDEFPEDLWASGPAPQAPRGSWMPKQSMRVAAPQTNAPRVIRKPNTEQLALLMSHGMVMDSSRYECGICAEEKHAGQFHAILGCSHFPNCVECMAAHYQQLVDVKGNVNTKCLNVTCNIEAQVPDLQRVMPSHLFEQYDKLMMKKMLEGMEDFRFCHNPHCGSGALGDPSAPIMTCEACLWKSCFVCNTSWHSGFTCEEYQQWLGEQNANDATEEYLKTMKKCPKCSARFQKAEGCIHIRCHCGAQFCYHCLADYTQTKERGLTCFHRKECHYNTRDA